MVEAQREKVTCSSLCKYFMIYSKADTMQLLVDSDNNGD